MKRPSVLALGLMAGCAAIPLKPGAELVRVTHMEPTGECKWLGDVTGSQGDSFTGQYTTNANLETGARNDLKNKAAALGGNLVVVITERAGQTGNLGLEGETIHHADRQRISLPSGRELGCEPIHFRLAQRRGVTHGSDQRADDEETTERERLPSL
jgi:hypothetical protein